MFNIILEAQTAVIAAIRSRYTLEQELALLNNTNDPTKALRIAKKEEIKEIIKDFNEANAYLSKKQIYPLRYDTNKIFDFGIQTDWDNESEVEGTVLYNYSNTYPEPTITEIRASKKNLEKNIDVSSVNLKNKKKILADLQQISDTYPNKDTMVADALADYKDEIQTYVRLTKLKNGLEESESKAQTKLNSQNSPAIEDEFSANIRETIKRTLQNSPNYVEYPFDVEAALVMRRKALDYYHTAKSDDEKAVAAERLSRTIESFNSNDELTRLPSIEWTVEEYNNTVTAFEDGLTQLVSSSESKSVIELALYDATKDNNLPLIALLTADLEVATQAYEAIAHDYRINADRLLKFHDSKITQVMYPGSKTVQGIETTGPAITPVGTNNETDPTKIALTTKNTMVYIGNQDAGHIIRQKLLHESLIAVSTAKLNDVIQEKNIEIRDLNRQKEEHSLTLENTSSEDAKLVATTKLASLDSAIDEKNREIGTAKVTYSNEIADNTKDVAHANQVLAKGAYGPNKNRLTQDDKEKLLLSSYNNYQKSQNELKYSTKELIRQRDNAERNAETVYKLEHPTAPQDDINLYKKNPDNWSPSDKASVTAATTKNNNDKTVAIDAALDLTKKTAAEGDKTLLQTITKIPTSELQRELADATKVAGALPETTPDPGKASNITTYTGFEGINNSRPFYLQMPTLSAITDFHLRNGINPYGKDKDEVARDAIHFTIYENTPPASRAEKVPGQPQLIRNIVSGTGRNTVGSFTIYPSNPDSLNIQHQHQYTSNDGLATSIVGMAVDAANTADALLSLGTTVVDSIKGGREVSMGSKLTRKIDTIDFYQSTEKQTLNIEFNLFTKQNFLNDIFKPIMFLTALSYPKRSLQGGGWDRLGSLVKDVTSLLNGGSIEGSTDPNRTIANTIAEMFNKIGVTAADAGMVLNKLDTSLAETGGFGPFRYFITKRPEYITIRHASGLFYFPLAYITGFNYQYMGPWYNYEPVNGNVSNGNSHAEVVIGNPASTPKTIGQSWEDLKKSASDVGSSAANLFTTNPFADKKSDNEPKSGRWAEIGGSPGESDSLGQLSEEKFNKSDVAYPTWAKCTLNVKCAHPMFRDDYMQMFYAAGNGSRGDGSSVVSVTEDQTGFAKNLITVDSARYSNKYGTP